MSFKEVKTAPTFGLRKDRSSSQQSLLSLFHFPFLFPPLHLFSLANLLMILFSTNNLFQAVAKHYTFGAIHTHTMKMPNFCQNSHKHTYTPAQNKPIVKHVFIM